MHYVIVAGLCLGLCVACEQTDRTPPANSLPDAAPQLMYGDGSWSPYWPELGHDGQPVQTEHFIVYSNYSHEDARWQLAQLAEELWPEILSVYQVGPDEFTWLPAYQVHKIHLFADYGQMQQSGLAYRDGAVVRAMDHPNYDQFYTPESYRRVLKHEISHVVEFLLIGTFSFRQANDVWLREGGATYSGGAGSPVDTLAKLQAWRTAMVSVPGGGNPISIHIWGDFPQEILDANRTIEYYPLFQLATRYLVEPGGNGTDISNLTSMYTHLGNGLTLPAAFELNFGISVSDFERDFFDLAEAFLAKSGGTGP